MKKNGAKEEDLDLMFMDTNWKLKILELEDNLENYIV